MRVSDHGWGLLLAVGLLERSGSRAGVCCHQGARGEEASAWMPGGDDGPWATAGVECWTRRKAVIGVACDAPSTGDVRLGG